MKNLLIIIGLILIVSSCNVTKESSVEYITVKESEEILNAPSDTIEVRAIAAAYSYLYEVREDKIVSVYVLTKRGNINNFPPINFIFLILCLWLLGVLFGFKALK